MLGRRSYRANTGTANVLFIAGCGPIVDPHKSRKLYRDVLGISFKEETDGYLHTEAVSGAKTFALWPLSQAAQSRFGKDSWPADIPARPEFDVENVEEATVALESAGYRMIGKNKKEPWGQLVSRFFPRRSAGRHHRYSVDAGITICRRARGSVREQLR